MDRDKIQRDVHRIGLIVGQANLYFHQWRILIEALDSGEYKKTFSDHSYFWITVEAALREKWTLEIQKLFDTDGRVKSIRQLVGVCKKYKGQFHIEYIKTQLIKSGGQKSAVEQMLKDKVYPTVQQFEILEKSVEINPDTRKIIENMRDKWLAHDDKSWGIENVVEEYKKMKRDDVEEMLFACWRAQLLLSGALMRGDSLKLDDWPDIYNELPEPYPMRNVTKQLLAKANC